MNIHIIVTALNDEDFITGAIKPLYNHCSGEGAAFKTIQLWSLVNICTPVENIAG